MASNSTTNTQSKTTHSVPASSATIADEYANNPFFLLANENLGFMLTTQPLIGPKNYMSWAQFVFLALSSKNKFGFVDGLIAEPDSSSSFTILGASVMYINNARDLWINLKDRLSQGNTPRLFKLGKEISHLAQGSLSLDAYNKEHLFRFLMGLNDGYGHVIMCYLILQEEKRINIRQSFNMIQSGDAIAMYVNNSKGFLGHQGQKNGGKRGNGKKDRLVCTYCGFTGHIADKFYKLHCYPPGYKPKRGNKAMANQVALMQTTRSCGFDNISPNMHSSFLPGGVHSGFFPGGVL
ncbi:uncharacterized protein LOC112032445 [Quercus suber]|uniref:uncharacterized protein LOC112032445 n=1 Tax=Quercus suber TaxID=58331 RepID=UPI000CE2419B|nr:uncharacterized protein LOC112032445 [Quercus suber]